jgi:hypothetical protein
MPFIRIELCIPLCRKVGTEIPPELCLNIRKVSSFPIRISLEGISKAITLKDIQLPILVRPGTDPLFLGFSHKALGDPVADLMGIGDPIDLIEEGKMTLPNPGAVTITDCGLNGMHPFGNFVNVGNPRK